MPVQLNVKSIRTWSIAGIAQKYVANVLLSVATSAKINNDKQFKLKSEVHTFFTHMSMPLNVGTYGLRLAALQTQNEWKTNTQFNFQFETGLSKTVGLFLGGEELFYDTTLEAMVQILVLNKKLNN